MASVIINTLMQIKEEEPTRFHDITTEAISHCTILARMNATYRDQLRSKQREIDNLRSANRLMTERLKDCYHEVNPVLAEREALRCEVLRLRRMMFTVISKIEQYSEDTDLTLQQQQVLDFVKREMLLPK